MGIGYGFDHNFEEVVAYYCATHRSFWGRIGSALDPSLIADPAAQVVIKACAAIANDTGAGPASGLITIQRLRRWSALGRLTETEVRDASDLLDEVEDAVPPDVDQVISEATPLIIRVVQQQALDTALTQFGAKGDLSSAIQALQGAGRIGQADTSLGISLGNAGFAAIAAANRTILLPTGVTELDTELEGGMPRGSLGVVCAGTGGGKSMFLNHVAAHALSQGRFVCLATLELSEARAMARLKAALLSVPSKDLLSGRDRIAKTRYAKIAGKLGVCFVRYFSPGITTVEDIEAWVTDCEQQVDAPMDVLVCDYADKMSGGGRKQDENDYKGMLTVYEGLRTMAERRDAWAWTASQPRRGWKGQALIDTDDLADSQHKARVTDLLVTGNRSEEDGDVQIKWFIAKFRDGKSRGIVGPLPQDWAHGRASLDAPYIWR